MNARKKYVFRFLDTIILLISFLSVCCSSYRDLCLRDTYNIGYIYILINVGIFLPSACIYTILHREVVVQYLPIYLATAFMFEPFFFRFPLFSLCYTEKLQPVARILNRLNLFHNMTLPCRPDDL